MEISECPQCGAPVSPSDHRCSYCHAEFVICNLAYLGGLNPTEVGKYLTHFEEMKRQDPNSVDALMGLGLCYITLSNFGLAAANFTSLIGVNPQVPLSYYYLSLAQIAGRKISLLSLNEARRLETNLTTAMALDPSLVEPKLLLAILRQNYYERNGLRCSPPNSTSIMQGIAGLPISKSEISNLTLAARLDNGNLFFDQLKVS